MALVMTSGPALEPVTVAEAKAHLRLDGTDEDVLIASLVLTARLSVEAALRVALISQSWKLTLDRWPKARELILPLRPVSAVTAVRVRAADGTASALAVSDFILDGNGAPARLLPRGSGSPIPGQPAQGIEIEFTAGFGAAAASVPEPIRLAILRLAAHWYEHRDPLEVGSVETAIPATVSALLMPFRTTSLGVSR